MGKIKLAAALPKAAAQNGLDPLAQEIVDHPERPIVAVVVLKAKTTTVDHTDDEKIPTLAILRVEPITNGEWQRDAAEAAVRSHEARTGQESLFDVTVDEDIVDRFVASLDDYDQDEDGDDADHDDD